MLRDRGKLSIEFKGKVPNQGGKRPKRKIELPRNASVKKEHFRLEDPSDGSDRNAFANRLNSLQGSVVPSRLTRPGVASLRPHRSSREL